MLLMNDKGLQMTQKASLKNDPPAKPKRRWLRYAALVSFGTAIAVGAVCLKKSGNPNPIVENVRPFAKMMQNPERPGIELPPAVIDITQLELNRGNPNFKHVDALIESFLMKTGDKICMFEAGLKDDVPDLMFSIKRKLESEGFGITTGAKSPKEIFERINSFYMENNVWIFIRTVQRIQKNIQESQKVACLLRVPVEGRASITFSFFDGQMSSSDVPIYYLSGVGMFGSDGIMAGVTTNRGLMIYSGVVRIWNLDRQKGLNDIAIHEAVHYDHNKKNRFERGDYDYDAISDILEPAEKKEIARDELRAFLVQMMYGNYPAFVLNSALMPSGKYYNFTREVVKESTNELLLQKQNDPRYSTRGVTVADLSTDEIRGLAYHIYLKHFPQK
jgi:hypothetical protein